MFDWPAQLCTVLRLCQRVFRDGKRIARIQPLITQETVEPLAPFVGAGLRRNVDNAAGSAPIFGNAARSDDLKFADDFLRIKRAGQSCCVIIGGQTVHDKTVVDVALSGHMPLVRLHFDCPQGPFHLKILTAQR